MLLPISCSFFSILCTQCKNVCAEQLRRVILLFVCLLNLGVKLAIYNRITVYVLIQKQTCNMRTVKESHCQKKTFPKACLVVTHRAHSLGVNR